MSTYCDSAARLAKMRERKKKPMPTVLRVGPYRFFFYAGDRDEPMHVHVERDDHIAKFWLDPIRLQSSGGFRRPEIAHIAKILAEHHTKIVESWNDYFGG